jgi:hypothetical protein
MSLLHGDGCCACTWYLSRPGRPSQLTYRSHLQSYCQKQKGLACNKKTLHQCDAMLQPATSYPGSAAFDRLR